MSARRSTFAAIDAMRGGGEARQRADAPATAYNLLRQYVGMRLIEVSTRDDGIELTVGPVGHMGRHRLLLTGTRDAFDITDFRDSALADLDAQHDDDIGDEMAERERYADRDIDIAPGTEHNDQRRPW